MNTEIDVIFKIFCSVHSVLIIKNLHIQPERKCSTKRSRALSFYFNTFKKRWVHRMVNSTC